MIVETIDNLKELIKEMENDKKMVSNEVTYQNDEVLKIVR